MNASANVDMIRDHMDVVCSNGKKLGVVDHLDGDRIKLTKDGSSDKKHHFIPVSIVDHVDTHVHLSVPGDEVMRTWETE